MGAKAVAIATCGPVQTDRAQVGSNLIVHDVPISLALTGCFLPKVSGRFDVDDDRWWQKWRSENRVEIALVTCYAGSVAQARYRKKAVADILSHDGETDAAHAFSLSGEFFETPHRASIACNDGLEYAKALIRSPKGWSAVMAIAAALDDLDILEASQVDELCHAAYGDRPLPFGWDPYWPPCFEEIDAGDLPTPDLHWPIPNDPDRKAQVFASLSIGPMF